MLPRIDHVAIVGAGFSGTLLAVNLLRHDGPRVTLIERGDAVARGAAYSTDNPVHLLNVRAANMSALPDEPDHFRRWRDARGVDAPDGFASRRAYGDYLAELLRETRWRWPHRLEVVREEAVEIASHPDRVAITLSGGARIHADVGVLALGNLPPHDPPAIDGAALPAGLYVSDPWRADVAEGLAPNDPVLILGTGLTMIDVVQTLDTAGHRGPVLALSRHGLVPHRHGPAAPAAPLAIRPAARGSALVAAVRARAAARGWRAAVDELRPHTQGMWASAPIEEQRRFVRHLRAWWDIHRHRLAPAVATRVAALRDAGRLTVAAGRVVTCAHREGQVSVSWRPRHGDDLREIRVARLINCTGPQGDLLRTREPLLRLLLAAGHIRPDPHRFGLQVNQDAEVIGAAGRPDPRLLALGPLTRGAFWEIVAVPDIRRQAWDVARRLSHAQWVGGEGL